MANGFGDFTDYGNAAFGSDEWSRQSIENYYKTQQKSYDAWKRMSQSSRYAGESPGDYIKRIQKAQKNLAIIKKKRGGFSSFIGKIGLHSQLLGEQREKLLGGFRTQTEAGIGRQIEAASRAATLRSQRQGLGRGGLGGRAAAQAELGLRGAGEAQFSDFQNKLGLLQSQQQDALLRGEFEFINQMARQENAQEFERSMTLLRDKLQRDRESRGAFWGLAGSIGGFLVGGPIGSAIGGGITNWLGGQGGGGGGAEQMAYSNPGGIYGAGPYGYGR